MKKLRVKSDSSQLTQLIAGEFASKISKIKSNSAKVITLKGDLGSGKTTFALGFLNNFGIKPHAVSPTFVIMKRYKINLKFLSARTSQLQVGKTQNSKIENIYHLDAYRLHSKKDLNVLGFGEILKNSKNIVLVEWPERIKGTQFKNKTQIYFSYGKKENERALIFSQ
jgi:tRNA threonylcarbamoyladenosine biosynthesis protein TsaE